MELSILDNTLSRSKAKACTTFPTRTSIWVIGKKISFQVKGSMSMQMDRNIKESLWMV